MQDLYLIATLAGQTIAIPAEQVSSVVDIGDVTVVPRAASHVRGLAALRSRVVTVIDAASAIGSAAPRESFTQRAVITQADGHAYALLVDALDDVASFAAMPLANGVVLDPVWANVARGVVMRDREPILVVDLSAFIPGLMEAAT